MAGSHTTPYRRQESNTSQASEQPSFLMHRRPSIDRTSDHGLSNGNSSESQMQSITAPTRPRRLNVRQLTRMSNQPANFRDLAQRRARRGDAYQQLNNSSSSNNSASRTSGRNSWHPNDSQSSFNGSVISSSASERSYNTRHQSRRGSSNESIVDLVPRDFERILSERQQHNHVRRQTTHPTRSQAETACCIVM